MSRKVTNFRGELFYTPNGNVVIKDEPVTPNENDFGEHNNLEDSFENKCNVMRKSLSMTDVTAIRKDFVKLEFSNTKQDVYNRHSIKQSTNEYLSKTKFVSMAESIYHYQTDTPDRFHTVRPHIFHPLANNKPKSLTVPHSPRLLSKTRTRPPHILSQKEIEDIQLEEIKKFKLKANPIPKSVIEGGHLPIVSKKPITIPKPFHLTEVQKKPIEYPDHVPSFKARPAPKHLEKPKLPSKPPTVLTIPQSPRFHYKRVNTAERLKCNNSKINSSDNKILEKSLQRMGPVKPKPFSFDKRDMDLKKRRDERIKQQIQEERKLATQFKAQSLPAAGKKKMQCTIGTFSTSNYSSGNKENYCKFEEKSPNTVCKEPLKPAIEPDSFVEPVLIELNAEKSKL